MAPDKKKFLRSLTFDLIPIKPHLTHGTKVSPAEKCQKFPPVLLRVVNSPLFLVRGVNSPLFYSEL